MTAVPALVATFAVTCGEDVTWGSAVRVGEMVAVFNGELQDARNSDSVNAAKSFIVLALK